MSRSLKNEDRLVQYLLGLIPEEEQIELEDLYLLDDDLNDELQAVERELMDSYLEGTLSEDQRNRFEQFFLSSPGRVEKLRFARALKAYGSKLTPHEKDHAIARPGPWAIVNSITHSYAGVVALLLMAVALGLVVWRVVFYRSPEQQTLRALSKAYHTG